MDMDADRPDEEPAEAYDDEVLNANWLPEPELRSGLQPVTADAAPPAMAAEDVEAFLASVYLHQE